MFYPLSNVNLIMAMLALTFCLGSVIHDAFFCVMDDAFYIFRKQFAGIIGYCQKQNRWETWRQKASRQLRQMICEECRLDLSINAQGRHYYKIGKTVRIPWSLELFASFSADEEDREKIPVRSSRFRDGVNLDY